MVDNHVVTVIFSVLNIVYTWHLYLHFMVFNCISTKQNLCFFRRNNLTKTCDISKMLPSSIIEDWEPYWYVARFYENALHYMVKIRKKILALICINFHFSRMFDSSSYDIKRIDIYKNVSKTIKSYLIISAWSTCRMQKKKIKSTRRNIACCSFFLIHRCCILTSTLHRNWCYCSGG